MTQAAWSEFERRCQKPDHRRVGNWWARRVARPLALRVTWVVAPWGVSAHAVTLVAWAVGLAAAATFASGRPWGWLVGAGLLQVWYLLDHVDGQLARWRRTASLDGVQLDYWMHATIPAAVAWGVGLGLESVVGPAAGRTLGGVWALGLLVVGLEADVRAKAMFQRLKRVRGELRAVGGGAARPAAPLPPPQSVVRFGGWVVRKACEMHVIMNLLGLAALTDWACERSPWSVAAVAAALALAAPLAAIVRVARSLHREEAEREFALWFRPAAEETLECVDGWWLVRRENEIAAPVCERRDTGATGTSCLAATDRGQEMDLGRRADEG